MKKSNLFGLVIACEFMIEKGIPSYGWTDGFEEVRDGQFYYEAPEETGHWTATKEEMEKALKRRLTQAEVTLLSLSRCFGPLPWFEGEWAHPVPREIWEGGNGSGAVIVWEDLLVMLRYYKEKEEFESSWGATQLV